MPAAARPMPAASARLAALPWSHEENSRMSDDAQLSEPKEAILPEGGMRIAAETLVTERLRALRRALGRNVAPLDVVVRRTRPASRRHLFEEACDLYWNELSWEEITDEEMIGDRELTEMVFPGLLALIDALLPSGESGGPDRKRERRDVAHDFLLWLAARLVELRNAKMTGNGDHARIRREAQVTDELIDLIAYRLYSLTAEEIEELQVH